MSSLSNLPYGIILDYWFEKLSGNPLRKRFLLTKFIEIFSFKTHGSKKTIQGDNAQFPSLASSQVLNGSSLCIVIPVYLKAEKDIQDISNLLDSIKNQTCMPDNVIIIDDCSPLFFTFPNYVTVHRFDKNYGPAKARNFGKKLALENGACIIGFTDADCILAENWTKIIKQTFEGLSNYQILSGNTPSFDKNWFGVYHDLNGTLNGRKMKDTDRLLYGTTANLAITREVASNINFNERFTNSAGEDIEFCFKANEFGYAIKHVPDMIVHHNYGYKGRFFSDLRRFSRQFRKYGKGELILLQEIPDYYTYFLNTNEIQAAD